MHIAPALAPSTRPGARGLILFFLIVCFVIPGVPSLTGYKCKNNCIILATIGMTEVHTKGIIGNKNIGQFFRNIIVKGDTVFTFILNNTHIHKV